MAIEKRVQIQEIEKIGEEKDGDRGGGSQEGPDGEDVTQGKVEQEDAAGDKKQNVENDVTKSSKMGNDGTGGGGDDSVDAKESSESAEQSEQEQKKDNPIEAEVDQNDSSGTDSGVAAAKVADELDKQDKHTQSTAEGHHDAVKPATQTIDVSIPQVGKEVEGINGAETNDDTDNQSVVMGTTKSVTFSVHPTHLDDDIDDEIARVTMNKASDDQMSSFDVEVDHEGRAQTTNTPVTVITEYQGGFRKSPESQREDIYEHAISVMRNRSSLTHFTTSQTTIKSDLSVGSKASSTKLSTKGLPVYELPTVIARIQEPPLANTANCSFYVLQKRVQPVPPIKAWKGYHNNVYFEPMICRKANLSSLRDPAGVDYPQNMIQNTPPQSAQKTLKPSSDEGVELPQINDTNQQNAVAKTTTPSVKSVRIAKSAASVRTGGSKSRSSRSRASTSIPKSRPLTTGSRQFAVMDKLSVLDNMDSHVSEDMRWIDGFESTGTLQVGTPIRRTGSTTHVYTRESGNRHYKMRICRGLVSHSLVAGGGQFPVLPGGVSGGRLIDSPTKLEYLEKEYQGESHFLSNPHGMFASPIPAASHYSSSPLPSLRRRSSAASSTHRGTQNSPVGTNDFLSETVV